MNYYNLSKIKVHYNYIGYIVFITMIITIILSSFLSTYDTYTMYGVYNEGFLEVSVNIENSDAVDKGAYFEYENKKLNYQILDVSGLNIENNTNYQTYKLKINKEFKQNKIIKITFFYNKERIITKILRIIF